MSTSVTGETTTSTDPAQDAELRRAADEQQRIQSEANRAKQQRLDSERETLAKQQEMERKKSERVQLPGGIVHPPKEVKGSKEEPVGESVFKKMGSFFGGGAK